MPYVKAGTGQKHIIALHFFDEESNIVRKHTCTKCSDTKLRHLKILRWHDKKWAEVYDIALPQTEWKWQIIYGEPRLGWCKAAFHKYEIFDSFVLELLFFCETVCYTPIIPWRDISIAAFLLVAQKNLDFWFGNLLSGHFSI